MAEICDRGTGACACESAAAHPRDSSTIFFKRLVIEVAMSEPSKATAASYRKQAEEARHSAYIALTTEIRQEYLKLAANYEKLANDIEDNTFISPHPL